MATIEDKVTQIREAIYGKDVRESIAIGIEAINIEVENTTARQTQLEIDMATVEANAIQATAEANAARDSANVAADNANIKAALADEKATLADQKATLVQQATDNANTTVTNINNNTLIIYKSWVNTYADIATTYKTPELGWTTQTKDTFTRYRWNGTEWVNIGVFTDDKIGDMGQISETNIVEAIQADRSSLADMATYLPSSYKGLDIADILQTKLNDSNVGDVHLPAGEYLLSKKVIIPAGKSLIMTGNNGSNYLTNAEASDKIFTKIKPTFDGDYCFELNDKSTIKNGFINCESMASGGGILIDFSQKAITKVNILGTLLSGGSNWGLYAIFLNGDRPSARTPGYGMFFKFDVGIIGFGIGVYLKRQDTYSALDSTTNGMAWINGIEVYGNMQGCQRYIYFNTVIQAHAGGSSTIKCRIQGGSVPDANAPAIEINGEGNILDCIFHDIMSTSPYQKVRYKIGNNAQNTYVFRGGGRNRVDVINNGVNTVFFADINDSSIYNTITSIDGDISVDDGWYTKNKNTVTVNFQIPSLAISSTWTAIYTLPFPTLKQTRKIAISNSGKFVSIMVQNNKIYVINNNTESQTVAIQVSYPVNF